MNLLVTGAAGYLGKVVLGKLLQEKAAGTPCKIWAMDVRETPPEQRSEHAKYVVSDVRSYSIAEIIAKNNIDTIIHLAAIVNPGKNMSRDFLYDVEVGGTENLLKAAVANGVGQIIISSSGAAYGYYADNPAWISEDTAILGNETFAYSYHKRLIEEMLARYRETHPALKQTIFRIGTILGEKVNNQITALFERSFLLALKGSDSPFVFIWDEDVAGCVVRAALKEKHGIYNVAGDGALTIFEIAKLLHKRILTLPPTLVETAFAILKKMRLTSYGPEQIDFLRYRPVLANDRLKKEFGYLPKKSSREVFLFYARSKNLIAHD